MEEKLYTVAEASTALDVSRGTLRRLCNSGLIPHVRRNPLGHRVLADWQIDYTRVLLGLKQAGFKSAELRRYTRLFRQGPKTLPVRKAMMETQKRQLWQQLEECQTGIDFLERNIELIDKELES